MAPASVVVSACGNAAVRVTSALADREAGWRLVHHLARRVDADAVPGVVGAIPTYDAVLIELDPAEASLERIVAYVEHAAEEVDAAEPLTQNPRTFDVPVLYDLDGELDLNQVATGQGVAPSEIVRLHSESTYVVRCLGSPGGSPMLDGPAFPRPVPRLSRPRAHVPQGVVSVAGRQATITPAAGPGGWPLIGVTPLSVVDLSSEPFVPYEPGDEIRFRAIDRDEYAALLGTRMVPA